MATKYMHTLDGRPATFTVSYGLTFPGQGRARLCDSLAEIRAQQKMDADLRRRRRWSNSWKYGYTKVAVGE